MIKHNLKINSKSLNKKILLETVLDSIKDKIKKNISTQSKGRVYTYQGAPYIASLPDHAPNIKSERLFRSVHTEIDDDIGYLGQGFPNDSYAAMLETGTRKMQMRPNLSTIIDKNDRFFRNAIYDFIEKELFK